MVLSRAAPALQLQRILFMVMGSSRFRHRTLLIQRTWCSDEGVRCLFFDDSSPVGSDPLDDEVGTDTQRDELPFVRVQVGDPPKRCCQQSARRYRNVPFFCERHRAATLHAQYRFLPALHLVRDSAAFRAGAFRWVVLVDDDSYVYARRLRWLLARLNHSKPLYLGDFGSSSDAYKRFDA
jgi:hypothetical protein